MTLVRSADPLSCVHKRNDLLMVESAVHSPDGLIRGPKPHSDAEDAPSGSRLFFTPAGSRVGPNNGAVPVDKRLIMGWQTAGLLRFSVTGEEGKLETRKPTVLVFVHHQLRVSFARQRWQNNCQLAARCRLLVFTFRKK